jgi:hypothetical protein
MLWFFLRLLSTELVNYFFKVPDNLQIISVLDGDIPGEVLFFKWIVLKIKTLKELS